MSPAASPHLRTRDLAVWRGERCLVRNLDLDLGPGELLWVRGPNGAGKTSLLRVLAGLSPPEAGVVERPAPRPDGRETLTWLGHAPGLKRGLTVDEALHLDLALAGHAATPAERTALLARVGLVAAADRPVEQLSAGQRRRVALARLAASPASVWLLDEPYTHLDDAAVATFTDLVVGHLAWGGCAVLVSHQTPEVPGVARREIALGGGP